MALRAPRELALAPLSAAERAQLGAPGTKLKVGLHRALPADAVSLGAWESLGEESHVWRMAIRSPGSEGVRLEFRNFSVGQGKVWLHDGTRSAGPYTGRGLYDNGAFWSATLFSESVTLEYEPAPDAPVSGEPPFEVHAVSHQAALTSRVAVQTGSGDSADYCHLDPNCFADWQPAMNMVAQISYEEDGARYVCSGALMATRDNSFKPYLLTAGHCINSEEAARSVGVYWKYQTPACGAKPPMTRDETSKSTLGGHLLASGSLEQGDYSLLLLREIPNDVTFSGWDLGDPAVGSPLTGIHHPTGSWKRISFGDRVSDSTAMIGDEVVPASRYFDVLWSRGRTEPGSSGSPLFSSPGVLVGMLTYGPVSPTLSACQISPSVSGYGRFSSAYPEIRDYVENFPAAEVQPDRRELSFTVLNHRAPAGQAVRLSTGTAAAPYKLRADAPWIQLSDVSGSVSEGQPATVSISVDPAQLSRSQQYSGTVTILSGAAAPQFINVTAIARVDQSNIVASVSPNPVVQSDGLWSFRIRVAETNGAATRLTGLRVNGAEYSEYIASWFGTGSIAASGAIEASLTAAGLAPGELYFEFWGVDEASGQEWYRVTSARFE
jgi:hypothetical protein